METVRSNEAVAVLSPESGYGASRIGFVARDRPLVSAFMQLTFWLRFNNLKR